MHRFGLWLGGAWVLWLAGCASVATQLPTNATGSGAPTQEAILQSANTQDQSASSGATPGTSGQGSAAEAVPRAVVSDSRAVVALVDSARLDAGAGRREAAGASLERALRIEPRNAWLWHELAQVRLGQGQYAQAISMAQKSNSFARKERRLQAFNWRLIADARAAQGNPAGAEQAFKRAAEFEP